MRETAKMKKKEVQSNPINLRELLSPFLIRWHFYLLTGAICFILTFLYLRYTIPTYRNTASLLINEDKNNNKSEGITILEDLELTQTSNNLMNEMEIMKANSVLEPVVDSLYLNISTFLIGKNSKLRRQEMFGRLPIKFTYIYQTLEQYDEMPGFKFFVEINAIGSYVFESVSGARKKVKFGDTIDFPKQGMKFVFTKTKYFNEQWFNKRFEYNLIAKEKAVAKLSSDLLVERKSKESSVVTLSIEGMSEDKNRAILTKLIESYQRDALNDRNIVKTNTSEFIKERIKFILEELNEVEKSGELYKKEKGIVNFDIDVNEFIESKSIAEKKVTDVSIQLNLVNILADYLNGIVGFEELLPANIGFDDQNINDMTDQYNKLILERKKLLQTSKQSNPLVQKAETQLISLKESIGKSLRNLKRIFEYKLKSFNSEFNKFDNELGTMPKFEREYRSILRQQQIKESLYLYLLQKREENEIELAASVTNIKIISPPSAHGSLISPQRGNLLLYALAIALILPTILIYILDFFDNKLTGDKDLDGLNVIGQIPRSKVLNSIIQQNDRSYISEAFRMLRANLNFYLSNQIKSPVIAVSSTIPNEGKTFISINLAQTLASIGNKVVIVGLDLRMPKLNDYVENIERRGVSNFIIDDAISVEDIVQPFPNNENLFIINAGNIPPNPAELLLKPRFKVLIQQLKEQFDFIIMDTSPIGIISDCLPIVKNEADMLLYVMRVGFLDKKLITVPFSLKEDGIVTNLAVVLNYTEPIEKRYNNSYKYGYGYSYGYGSYYGESYFGGDGKKDSLILKLIRYLVKKR